MPHCIMIDFKYNKQNARGIQLSRLASCNLYEVDYIGLPIKKLKVSNTSDINIIIDVYKRQHCSYKVCQR